MRYDGMIFRPPSEAGSLIIQATVGCPHNRCAFCRMYKDKKFRRRPIEEVIEDLDMAHDVYGDGVRTIFIADGNTAVLHTDYLIAFGEAAHQRFPHLERITMYGSARYMHRKTTEEWGRIAKAGVKRIHSGLESGDPETLEAINKGVTPEQAIEAYRHVRAAGVELSVYLMVGLAGIERWREHADGTAHVLNATTPDFVRLRTFVPAPTTPWHDRWARGELTLLDPYQALHEIRRLVEQLEGPMHLLSDHMANFLNVHGHVPEDKAAMLAFIDEALTWPRDQFRVDSKELIGTRM